MPRSQQNGTEFYPGELRSCNYYLIAIYIVIQKKENLLNEKNIKIAKQKHAFKGYAGTYGLDILNYFNPELQLKDIESGIKSNLIELLTQLKGFEFVTALVSVFKKIESEDKTKYHIFYWSSKAEIVINDDEFND